MKSSSRVDRHSTAHALLELLAAVGAMHPKTLHHHGMTFAAPSAVSVAFNRLQERGLVECKVILTSRGRRTLKGLA